MFEREDNGKVKTVKKHETPTRVGGGTVGLATGPALALLAAAAAIGAGLHRRDDPGGSRTRRWPGGVAGCRGPRG